MRYNTALNDRHPRPAAPRPRLRVIQFSRAAARIAPRGSFDIVYSLARTARQDIYRAGGGSHASYMEHRYSAPIRALYRLSPRHAVILAMEERIFRDTTQNVVCNSEMVRRELQDRYPITPERITVILNGVDVDHFHPENRSVVRDGACASVASSTVRCPSEPTIRV